MPTVRRETENSSLKTVSRFGELAVQASRCSSGTGSTGRNAKIYWGAAWKRQTGGVRPPRKPLPPKETTCRFAVTRHVDTPNYALRCSPGSSAKRPCHRPRASRRQASCWVAAEAARRSPTRARTAAISVPFGRSSRARNDRHRPAAQRRGPAPHSVACGGISTAGGHARLGA